jgi:hypothetical protein
VTARALRCSACGRLHLTATLIRHPDRPHILLCPVRWRGMRLPRWERDEANRLLQSAFGDESAPGHEFPASDAITWPADPADAADAADEWWNG